MNVQFIRSDKVYDKMIAAPAGKRTDIYRYELMLPFKKKWDCYNIPMKAQSPGGYDVIMASEMLGHLPPEKVDDGRSEAVALLSPDELWAACRRSVERSLNRFAARGIELPVQDYLFTVLLADETSPYIVMSEGYSGDGGIPGYIMGWLTPNPFTIARLPVALAHETNHNVRYQFIKWSPDVTLGEMLASEGLAENFATALYGEEMAGPWVTKTEIDWLDDYIKPIIHEGLGVQGLSELNAYLYGDEMAALQGFEPVGLPYCAGYACGYHLIRHYLKKTGMDIAEATILPPGEILAQTEDFWNAKTVW